MPIKHENKKLYPKNWGEISRFVRFTIANNKCQFCGLPNYSYVNRITRELCLPDENDSIRIVLTTAHLDHNPSNCNLDNLKALCQKCHNNYDIDHRKETRLKTKEVENKNQKKLF